MESRGNAADDRCLEALGRDPLHQIVERLAKMIDLAFHSPAAHRSRSRFQISRTASSPARRRDMSNGKPRRI